MNKIFSKIKALRTVRQIIIRFFAVCLTLLCMIGILDIFQVCAAKPGKVTLKVNQTFDSQPPNDTVFYLLTPKAANNDDPIPVPAGGGTFSITGTHKDFISMNSNAYQPHTAAMLMTRKFTELKYTFMPI